MKALSFFFIIILLGTLNISCSPSKKEIDSVQNEAGKIPVLKAAQKKTAEKDTIFSPLSSMASAKNDTMTGTLYVAGNEPFTKLALYISSDTVFYVEADSSLKSQLWQLQGKRVRVIGMIKSSPMGTEINVSSFHTVP